MSMEKSAGIAEDKAIQVSVVMPSLNVRPYIRECIESVMASSLTDIEIICVDAGSEDGTLEILREYAEIDERIRILVSPQKSYGFQMNMGLDAARGKYLAIVETDDVIEQTKYEDLFSVAEKNELDIVRADFRSFKGNGEDRVFKYLPVIGEPRLLEYNTVIDPAQSPEVLYTAVYIWTGIYNLEFIRKNGIRFHESPGASYQDNGFWFITTCCAHRMMFLNRSYYNLRRDRPESSCYSKSKVYCLCEEYDFIRNELRKRPELEKRYAPMCAMKRFSNYEWTYRRIADEFKEDFLKRFTEDFRKLREDGEICEELYRPEDVLRLRAVLDSPDTYQRLVRYMSKCAERNKADSAAITRLKRKVIDTQRKAERAEKKLAAISHSVSYRLGRKMTWIPRKAREAIRSFCAAAGRNTKSTSTPSERRPE